MPRLPASAGVVLVLVLPLAAALSMTPCWTIVLLTVKRYGGGVEGVSGLVAVIRAFRIPF
jgi:hypothetical protein